jgi:cellulose synthase/poly-beta-1,6-N-acetylglucosamine synthase-like glycosyltransferase
MGPLRCMVPVVGPLPARVPEVAREVCVIPPAIAWAGALIACGSLVLIFYVYAGYPLLLWLITRFYQRPVRKEDATPHITLLISAFNEEDVIHEKIRNSLDLDYPRDRIEIIVVSDCSEDATDEIVNSFSGQGVVLLRMPERGGKTLGLNAALRRASGSIVLFSDANILYRPDVVRKLAANFADPQIGCVTGDSVYARSKHAADRQESSYWRYERWVRSRESELGSTVGGDGAIFAIRRQLYSPLAPDAINDLVIPLQIVARGYRAVFEPQAVGVEPAAGSFRKEFRRKQRIVNRSWRGVMANATVLNPFHTGLFAWQVFSHKVLRWLVLVIMAAGLLGCLLAFRLHWIYPAGLAAFASTLVMALIGRLSGNATGAPARITQAAYYFYLVNLASLIGVARAITGRVDSVWSPERSAIVDSGNRDSAPG